MVNKVYDKIKQILKENWKFFLILIVSAFICLYEFPYYIDAPGGIMDVSKRIELENSYDSEGSFNLAYVSEIKATIPTLLVALLNPNWDILKEEEILYDNETMQDVLLRDHLLLEESLSNAVVVGFEKAKKEVKKKSEKVYVSYKMEDANATLKVGDQIVKVNGIEVKNKEHLSEIIKSLEVGKSFDIEVLYNKKKEIRTAILQEMDGRNLIGVVLTQIIDVETTPKVEFQFSKNESGPSGGFMSALTIYNQLTKEDLTKGRKIVGTGTIELDGSVGSIGGVKYKLKGAVKKKADIFFVPSGENYEEALELQKKYNYDIQIVSVSNIDDAILYLKQLEKRD